MQARLKPYDPAQGHIRRGLTISTLGLSFDEGVIKDGITEHQAKVLREVRQRDGDPNSPLAFDVCPESEMKKLLAAEARKKLNLAPEAIQAVVEDLAEQAAVPVRSRRPRGQPA